MTLRVKTLLIIGLTIVLLVTLIVVASRLILLDSFVRLENELAQQNVARVVNAIQDDIATFARGITDWAYWTDTYNYVQGMDAAYEADNLLPSAFINLKVDELYYLRPDASLVYAAGVDAENEAFTAPNAALAPYLAADNPLMQFSDDRTVNSGLIVLDDAVHFVAAARILTNEQQGPPAGTLIWTRTFDSTALAALAESTRLNVQLYPYNAADLPEEIAAARNRTTPAAPYVAPLDQNTLAAYAVLTDLANNPALIVRVEMPRSVYQQGEASVWVFTAALLVAGLVLMAAALLLLEGQVLAPLARLQREVRSIGASGSPTARLNVRRQDELGQLAQDIDSTLDALQEAQGRLRASQQQLATVIASTPILLVAVNRDQRVVLAEGRALEDFGLRAASLIGLSIEEAAAVSGLPQFEVNAQRALTGETFNSTLTRGKLTYDVRYTPDTQGGFIAVATDVSERVQAQQAIITAREASEQAREAAEAANRAKSTFLANMSHELRTPLGAIIGYGELLREMVGDQGDEAIRADIERILHSAQILLALIEDLLSLAKLEAGKMEVYAEMFPLGQIIQNVASAVAPQIGRNNNTFTVDAPPDLPQMYSDPVKVQQILLNLCSNAAKFTQDGAVTLRVRVRDDAAELTVIDTGIGMSEREIAGLFRDFVQVDSSSTRKYGGSGLGLSISKRYAEILGGAISVSSEPGKGSTFTVRLPLNYTAQD